MSVRRSDMTEAITNAVVGLGISIVLVWILRAVGWWDASALAISAIFFVASIARGYVLRRLFRMLQS